MNSLTLPQLELSVISRVSLSQWSVYWSFRTPFMRASHTCAEYEHSKNRCVRVSKGSLHKMQDTSPLVFQHCILSPVANLPCIAIQVTKAYLGVACLNQTTLYQSHKIWLSLMLSQVSFVEKLLLNLPFPFFHIETSSSWVQFSLNFSISSSILLSISTLWRLVLWFLQSSTVYLRFCMYTFM